MDGTALPGNSPLRPLALSAALVAYGNASALLSRYRALRLPGEMSIPNLLGTALLLTWARRRAGLTREEVGLKRSETVRSAGWGILTGILMALPPLALFVFPPVLSGPITYRPMATLNRSQFLRKLALELPIATALCEELAFRGVLQALFRRCLSRPAALLATNGAFAFWHGVVNYHTVSETNVASTRFVPLAHVSALMGVFAGGAVFSILRERTGSLAGSVAAHWIVDALMMAAMRWRG